MPWFDPQPTDDEIQGWINPGGEPVHIGRWPRSGTNRTSARFRLTQGEPPDAFTASRYLCRFLHQLAPPGEEPDPPIIKWGWFDLAVASFPFNLFVNMPTDTDGFSADLNVFSLEDMDRFHVPGVEIQAFWNQGGVNQVEQYYGWSKNGPRPWRYNPNMDTYPPDLFENAIVFWPFNVNELTIWAVPDCFVFYRDG